MATIVNSHRHQQPHDLRPGERFDPACLYVHDSGAVYCGAHVGTEASYTPQAWSCLGLGPMVEYVNERGGTLGPLTKITTTFCCEICYPRGFRAGR